MNDRFVLDNSVVMTWCFLDEIDPYADAVLDSLTEAVAVVPAIWPSDVHTTFPVMTQLILNLICGRGFQLLH